MRIIGLTGGIGSGKSTVAGMLRELGATVLDADVAAREVVEPGQPALDEIRAVFGDAVIGPDGRLDRAAVAGLVFADEAKRARLNEITHPRVREWMAERVLESAARGVDVVVMDTPLLFEAGLEKGMAATIVVWVPEEVQVSRAVTRGMDEDDVRARVRAQMPLDEKRRLATYVVDNSDGLESTRAQVEETWAKVSAG